MDMNGAVKYYNDQKIYDSFISKLYRQMTAIPSGENQTHHI